jgi:hypothetical protein
MERVYIQWTIVNWITVFFMAMLGFLILGLIAQAAHNMVPAGSSGSMAAS